jgi:RNA polymerase sigma-70 factor (ECF subfamily)
VFAPLGVLTFRGTPMAPRRLDSSAVEDVHLVGRAAAGDSEAFARLFDRHSAVVLGLLVHLLRDRGQAEEVLQETFLQAWQSAGRFEPALAAVRGWLLMMARSRALDRLRASSARQRREEAAGVADGAPRTEAVGTSQLEATERGRAVRGAVGELPPEQRRCIELAFFDGLTHTQIAERLQAPLGTVKSRILLGMNKLRQGLSTYYAASQNE